MKKSTVLGLAASVLLSGAALAQTGTVNSSPATPGSSGAASTMGNGTAGSGVNGGAVMSRGAATGTMPGTTGSGQAANGQNAAGGNDNQAVATTDANAQQPASGANSFTVRQATARLHKEGYMKVTGLKKDSHGVWRGQAQKDGAPVQVWLDYKGNIGQS